MKTASTLLAASFAVLICLFGAVAELRDHSKHRDDLAERFHDERCKSIDYRLYRLDLDIIERRL